MAVSPRTNLACSLPVLICFATSLDLTFFFLSVPFLVVDPLHLDWQLLGLLEASSSGLSPDGLRGVKKMVCLARPPAMISVLRIDVT